MIVIIITSKYIFILLLFSIDELPSRDLDSTIIGLSLPLIIIIFSIFLILAVILYYVLVKKNCSGGYFVKNKEKEEKKGKA